MSRKKNRNTKKITSLLLMSIGCLVVFGFSISDVVGDGERREAEIMSDASGFLSVGPDHSFIKADPENVDNRREEDPNILEERGASPSMGPAIVIPDTQEEELRKLFEARCQKWIPLEELQTDDAGFVLVGKITGASKD